MKHIVLILAVFGLMLMVHGGDHLLSPEDFQTRLEAGEGVLLDVRTPDEYKAGHLPTSENLDYFGKQFEQELEKLDKEKTYFIYCRSGKRSGKTAAMMKKIGLQKVYDMKGGFLAWQAAGLPVEKEEKK